MKNFLDMIRSKMADDRGLFQGGTQGKPFGRARDAYNIARANIKQGRGDEGYDKYTDPRYPRNDLDTGVSEWGNRWEEAEHANLNPDYYLNQPYDPREHSFNEYNQAFESYDPDIEGVPSSMKMMPSSLLNHFLMNRGGPVDSGFDPNMEEQPWGGEHKMPMRDRPNVGDYSGGSAY